MRGRQLGGMKFRRQVPIEPYFADFACAEQMLIVELDGPHHALDEAVMHDERRRACLEANGWRVLRFWNDEVLKNLDHVLQTILSATDREPSP